MKLFINKLTKIAFCFFLSLFFISTSVLYSETLSIVIDANANMLSNNSVEIAREKAVKLVKSVDEFDEDIGETNKISVIIFAVIPSLTLPTLPGEVQEAPELKLRKFIIDTREATFENKEEIIGEIDEKINYIKRKYSSYQQQKSSPPYYEKYEGSFSFTKVEDLKESLEMAYSKVKENFSEGENTVALFSNAPFDRGWWDTISSYLFNTEAEKRVLKLVKEGSDNGISLVLWNVNGTFNEQFINDLEKIEFFDHSIVD